MLAATRFLGVLAIAALGCADGKKSNGTTTNPNTTNPNTNPTTQEPAMTTTDPRDPKAWEEAGAIAQKAAGTAVTKRNPSLPFLFQTADGKGFLVHHGKLVTERGADAAGSYLRDVGIIKGMGPSIDDALFILKTLDAIPTVDKLAKTAFVPVNTEKRFADLAARIETDGTTAKVVLHYLLDGEPTHQVDPDPSHKKIGSKVGGSGGFTARPMARMSLTIPSNGTCAWVRENLNWGDPG